jgi:predicted acylesterase/phospholipase RssA
MFGESNTATIEWLRIVEWSIATITPPFWLWYYRRFFVGFIRFGTTYFGLSAVLAVLYAMIYGLLGSNLGIPYLFWHDDFWARAFSSAGATMLLALLGMIAYYLDPYPWATSQKLETFLEADEEIKRRIDRSYARRFPILHAPADVAQRAETKLHWWDYLTFGFNTLLDPIAITPVQLFLEPNQENTLMLQRFLRAARAPFLLMLLAPAALPLVFSEVPHAAPTGKLGLEWIFQLEQPPTYDVSRHFGGYLIGLAAWLLGIYSGLLVIKASIRFSSLLYETKIPDALDEAFRGFRTWLRKRRLETNARGRATDPNALGLERRGGARSVRDRGTPVCPLFDNDGCPGTGCPRGDPSRGVPAPEDCVAPGQRGVAVFFFMLLFITAYALLGFIRHLRVSGFLPRYPIFGLPLFDLPPAFAICVALAVLAMGYATIAYLHRFWQFPALLLLVVWLAYANHDPFKVRFEKLSYCASDLVSIRKEINSIYGSPMAANPIPGHMVSDAAALNAWKSVSQDGGPDLDGNGRPKLVLVAVSGGATRSAYWTAVVLDHLERTLGDSFGRRIRIISGASGGMLGAACYVTYRRSVAENKSTPRQGARNPNSGLEPPDLLPFWIRAGMPLRSMDPLARAISLTEFWHAMSPQVVAADRGVVLEQDWWVLRYPLFQLHTLEAAGKIPSIIFSPMIVEDGRRLLISNLELASGSDKWPSSPIVEAACQQINQDEQTENGGPGKKSVGKDGAVHRRLSLSSLEYYRIFHKECDRDLLLSTAVRMSASFPFVSPAVNLPTDPPRRVVDAGYYDNYGIQIATSWIRRNSLWLAQNTSGVLLVQIRDSSSDRDRLDEDDAEPGVLSSAFQFFSSPIDAIAKARNSTSSFRNDSDVAALDSSNWEFASDRPFDPATFFSSVIFENSAEVSLEPGEFWNELTKLYHDRAVKREFREVSMSWYLARAEMTATAAAIPHDPPEPRSGEIDWRSPLKRHEMIDSLSREIFTVPPGPARAIRLKRLDQLYNYERLLNLKKWWERKAR